MSCCEQIWQALHSKVTEDALPRMVKGKLDTLGLRGGWAGTHTALTTECSGQRHRLDLIRRDWSDNFRRYAIKLDIWPVPYKQGNVTTTRDSHLKVRRYFGFQRNRKKKKATHSFSPLEPNISLLHFVVSYLWWHWFLKNDRPVIRFNCLHPEGVW